MHKNLLYNTTQIDGVRSFYLGRKVVTMPELEALYMRRQKRDMNDRAFDRGYQAGVSGRSSDFCPHEEDSHKQNWLTGWREGRVDQWDGLTGVSGVHKIRAV